MSASPCYEREGGRESTVMNGEMRDRNEVEEEKGRILAKGLKSYCPRPMVGRCDREVKLNALSSVGQRASWSVSL